MTVAHAILEHYPDLTESQCEVVGHTDGPLLVIVGPGSGKTHSIVLRALNLLLLERAKPNEIVLSTFTEKAAFEMRDRLAAAARKAGYAGDLSESAVSTIHGFCHRALTRNRHRTALGHNHETLNELTQLLFIYERFDEILDPPDDGLFLNRCKTRWIAINGARDYFDKVTGELAEPRLLAVFGDAFPGVIGSACQCYEQALPYRPERVDEAGRRFDATVGRIRAEEFSVTTSPKSAICRECDLRALWRGDGVIGEIGESKALAA